MRTNTNPSRDIIAVPTNSGTIRIFFNLFSALAIRPRTFFLLLITFALTSKDTNNRGYLKAAFFSLLL